MKMIDIPPVWLLLCLGIAWAQSTYYPVLSLDHPVTDFLGGVLIGSGLILIAMAVVEFRKWKTTIIPHQEANALLTTGIFSKSRNPIYLADALILLGFILRWDAVLCLPLVPIFIWWIERHFILDEERRLRSKFGVAFHRYTEKTRRWL
ncbi:isoprenylcysteine carboxylmethyltransferase family protein [Cognatishimia sp. MH4019]|uniref:methyltransferase family protein n=1 Tax=Cognatishimia sp. MH4019 TaxID=2854030 RepID=UPI001CD3262B|nr:isoprenylcysteine carboxylmethyltransferase family protein [Cognatishimia sp. MH4019]